jgi:hypothetical protein
LDYCKSIENHRRRSLGALRRLIDEDPFDSSPSVDVIEPAERQERGEGKDREEEEDAMAE